jgi:peptidoglycan biosynthesis protein MviN/MurJ (putative lipid II flippase)
MTRFPVTSSFREPVKISLAIQVFTTVLLVMLLDGGNAAKAGAAAMIGYWIGVAIVMYRRPRSPSRLDLVYVRWGYLLMLIIGLCLLPWMGALRR